MKQLISAREKLAIKLLLLLGINNINIICFFPPLIKRNGILNINRLAYNSSSSLLTLSESSFLAYAATTKNN